MDIRARRSAWTNVMTRLVFKLLFIYLCVQRVALAGRKLRFRYLCFASSIAGECYTGGIGVA
eukprot:387336-Amphidinium_carterae.1